MKILERTPTNVRQRGAVLIVSLLILLVMTLLGVTALKTTVLEERMAGNLRDQQLAFQAAEAALREGQRFLNQATLPAFDDTNGLYQPQTPAVSNWSAADWLTNGRAYTSTALVSLNAMPRYVIEDMGLVPDPGGSVASDEALPETGIFRITTRAVGGSANAVVVLQSTYMR